MRDQIAALVIIFFASFGGVYAMLAGGDNAGPAVEVARVAPPEKPKPRIPDDGMARFIRANVRLPLPEATLLAPDGQPRPLAAFRGKVVLLNLWASWCLPCLAEMPALDRLQKAKGGAAFEVVAINLDRKAEAAKAFLAEHNIKALAFYRDQGLSVYKAFGAPDLPLSVLVDRKGRIIGRLSGGAHWDGADAHKLIDAALAENASAPAAGG